MRGLTAIPGIRVGHATNLEALTGCTAVLCGDGAVGGVDIRGSATGTQEIEVLSPGHVTDRVHAIVLAGGSAFGLEAASGVRRYLERQKIGFPTGVALVPIVPSAILYDLAIGRADIRPTREMGESAAVAATANETEEGCVGAGTGATVGKLLGMKNAMKSGIGCATVQIAGGVIVAAMVAVNALGDVREPATGKTLAGTRKSPDSREFEPSDALLKSGRVTGFSRSNTTLAVVATNARLNKVEATKLAQFAGLGMARTIYPVNTMMDGDIVFALSKGELKADLNALGVAAAEAVAEAILRGVRSARSLGGLPGLAG